MGPGASCHCLLMLGCSLDNAFLLCCHGIEGGGDCGKLALKLLNVSLKLLVVRSEGFTFALVGAGSFGGTAGATGKLRCKHGHLTGQGLFRLNLLFELSLKHSRVGLGSSTVSLTNLNTLLQVKTFFVGKLVALQLGLFLVGQGNLELGHFILALLGTFVSLFILLLHLFVLRLNLRRGSLKLGIGLLELRVKVGNLRGQEALGIRAAGKLGLQGIDMINKHL
mmetsp:Transcript_7648/g.13500  ORF Transcript_7648/g.13500 Transcript_7648/m.13500 type:complete len:223 (+) Transcript_7648:387-1055(+)